MVKKYVVDVIFIASANMTPLLSWTKLHVMGLTYVKCSAHLIHLIKSSHFTLIHFSLGEKIPFWTKKIEKERIVIIVGLLLSLQGLSSNHGWAGALGLQTAVWQGPSGIQEHTGWTRPPERWSGWPGPGAGPTQRRKPPVPGKTLAHRLGLMWICRRKQIQGSVKLVFWYICMLFFYTLMHLINIQSIPPKNVFFPD